MKKEYDFSDLTIKQKRFCEEYVIDWNATRSAIASGYSKKTAQVMGSENLTKPIIKAYIDYIQKDLAKLAQVSALRNVLELKKIAYTNLSDFKDGWMTERAFDDLSEEQKAALSEIVYTDKTYGENKERVVKFKVHDKMRAIELMNKMLGYDAATRLQHGVDPDNPIQSIPLVLSDGRTYEDLKDELKPE